MRNRMNHITQLVAGIGGALGMKWYYSAASVNQLRWILAPTTVLVEFITGRHFSFESHAGYMSSDHTFLIAASCAGANFLITAFLMLVLRQLWKDWFKQTQTRWTFLPISAAVAYGTTVIANTARISIALQMQSMHLKLASLDPEQLHRLEGIIVYFGFLLMLFVLAEGRRESRRLHLLRTCVFPLTTYYAVTLGLPLANGAYRQTGFWEHSVFVLLAPMVVILSMGLLANLTRKFHPTHVRHTSEPLAKVDSMPRPCGVVSHVSQLLKVANNHCDATRSPRGVSMA
jgi:exosortase K